MANGLINSAQVKQYALEYAAECKHHKFNRVSTEFLVEANRRLELWIEKAVSAQPSKGKTIR